MSRKGGLGGQGLSALIKSTDNEIRTAAEEAEKNGVLEIDVSLIDVNPDQPRKVFNEEEIQGLAESIKENGLLIEKEFYGNHYKQTKSSDCRRVKTWG